MIDHPAFWLSLVLCAALVAGLRPLLQRWVLDTPNHRSSHVTPVPRGGGVAIALTLAALLPAIANSTAPPLLILLGGLGLLGLADDIVGLGVRLRIVAEVILAVAAMIAVVNGAMTLLVPIGVLLIVGYVNAFNFMDGINTISGSVAVATASWYAYWATTVDSTEWQRISLAIAGASLGFLMWNARGRIFLGDSGSYVLGGLLMFSAIELWLLGTPLLILAAPLVPYLFDTVSTVILRIARRQSVTESHRDHVYQRLVDAGWSHAQSTGAVLLFVSGACACALLGTSMATPLAWSLLATAYMALPKLASERTADRGKSRSARSGS